MLAVLGMDANGVDAGKIGAGGESSGKLAAYRINGETGELQRFATYDGGKRLWWVMAVRVAGN